MFPTVRIILVLFLAYFNISWAHPGHDHQVEAAERSEYLKHNTRSLSHCTARLKSRGHEAASLKRRQHLAHELRRTRGLDDHPFLKARDLDSVLSQSHRSNDTSINLVTPLQDIFSDNSSCILQPEVTEGPFYVSGELIRRNITNGEEGVPLALDMQIIDVTTCEPVDGVYVDIWHCNATGVYSGIIAAGNGVFSDNNNVNNTAFRGLQKTDDMGVVQFDTIFPGHYAGRTNHIHLLTLVEDATTLLNNNTVSGLTSSHSGQMFFDQSLQAEVETIPPYTANTQDLTTNAEDAILATEARSSDPMMEYVLLGERVTDGILGWISIGINASESRPVSAWGQYAPFDTDTQGVVPVVSRSGATRRGVFAV
ncbi:hypothetical protein EPUS_04763 [Endocarpon pusillum Z07020]|uniref:Intradiol ring-cleavage dioxygenases domain-containing protein n=1 Tax=Endocarpon pusillum (strain Z07020 / HMAS-L-300199) TaxID=1263415 RepID=U1HQL0_ENDPU|nr:uncharacterized protein EPUS_04763 [Endocarpon pusillum Z07020]ERF72710.1 hypothetical protein EPUS_04763 [Endocarpon pusillum Z07020]